MNLLHASGLLHRELGDAAPETKTLSLSSSAALPVLSARCAGMVLLTSVMISRPASVVSMSRSILFMTWRASLSHASECCACSAKSSAIAAAASAVSGGTGEGLQLRVPMASGRHRR